MPKGRSRRVPVESMSLVEESLKCSYLPTGGDANITSDSHHYHMKTQVRGIVPYLQNVAP